MDVIKGIEVSESKLRVDLNYILGLDVEDDIKIKILSFKKKIYIMVIECQ